MKKSYALSFLFCLGMMNMASAQSFEFETAKRFELNIDPESWKDATIYFKNTGDKDLTIKWTVLKNTLVTGWDYSLCDNGQCYIGIPSASETAPLPPTEKGYFKLAVSAENIKGNGELVIFLENKDNPSESDTIAYSVNVGSTSSIAGYQRDIQIGLFPNPAQNTLKLFSKNNLVGATVSVIAPSGQEVLSQVISSEGQSISVSHLVPGVYVLQVETREGLAASRLFTKE